MAGVGMDTEYDRGVKDFTDLSGIKKLVYEINEKRGWCSIMI